MIKKAFPGTWKDSGAESLVNETTWQVLTFFWIAFLTYVLLGINRFWQHLTPVNLDFVNGYILGALLVANFTALYSVIAFQKHFHDKLDNQAMNALKKFWSTNTLAVLAFLPHLVPIVTDVLHLPSAPARQATACTMVTFCVFLAPCHSRFWLGHYRSETENSRSETEM